jgi:hypothetical protein
VKSRIRVSRSALMRSPTGESQSTEDFSASSSASDLLAILGRSMRSNEKKISDGYRERAPIEVESVLIIGKRDRAAGSRSLHRLVRSRAWLLMADHKEAICRMDTTTATAAKAMAATRLQAGKRRSANQTNTTQQAMTATEKYRCGASPEISMNETASNRTPSETGMIPEAGRE